MMQAFDLPVPFTTIGRRNVSNVPAQALILMNDPFVLDQAAVWARRTAPTANCAQRVRQMYLTAFSRPPTEGGNQRRDRVISTGSGLFMPRKIPPMAASGLTRARSFQREGIHLPQLTMHHCGNFTPRALTRREMLARCANGFGAIALTALLSDKALAAWRVRIPIRTIPSRRASRSFPPGRSTSSFSTWMAAPRRSIPSIPSRG